MQMDKNIMHSHRRRSDVVPESGSSYYLLLSNQLHIVHVLLPVYTGPVCVTGHMMNVFRGSSNLKMFLYHFSAVSWMKYLNISSPDTFGYRRVN